MNGYYSLNGYYNLGAAPAGYFQNPTDIDSGGPIGYPMRCFGTSGNFVDFDDQYANKIPLDQILNQISNQSQHFRELSQGEINSIASNLSSMQSRFGSLIKDYENVRGVFASGLQDAQNGNMELFNRKIQEGLAKLRAAGDKKFELFKEVDTLMLKAQDIPSLRRICSAKFELVQALDRITAEAGNLAKSGLKIERNNISMLNAFVDDVVQRATNVVKVLDSVYQDVAGAASFFIKHKWLLYGGLGLVGLTAVAFIARPYFQAIFR